jgi:NADPH-dependent ferric siderophore reductase
MSLNLIHRSVVQRVQRLSPGMVRVVLGGAGLDGFASTGVGDEYFRVFFPHDGQAEPELPFPTDDGYWAYPAGVDALPMRTYTVRHWDAREQELTVDFVVHEGGVAAAWALSARPGEVVGVNTPKGLYAPPAGITWQLLVADATGLPAAARLAETAPQGVRTRVVLEVATVADQLELAVPDGVDVHWVHGGNGTAPTRIEEIVAAADLPEGPGYIWVAGETKATRGVRRFLRHELGLPSTTYKVVGYWTENAELWRERYDGLAEGVRLRLAMMWKDSTRDEDEIEDAYVAELERLGL